MLNGGTSSIIYEVLLRAIETFHTLIQHHTSIVAQSSTIPARELMEERKREINAQRRAAANSRIDRIDQSLSPDLLQAVQQTRDKEPARG